VCFGSAGVLQTVNTAGFDWLGFDMTPATRSRLLLEGMRAGKKFLEQQ